MAQFSSLSASSKNLVVMLIVFVLAFDLAFVGQKIGGAYGNEFGGHRHEASHFMSGLFWRDFVVSMGRAVAEGKHEPLSEDRKNFTRNYEAHYPRVDTGSERSLFTGVEAVWMLALPATRGSLLLLVAALSGMAATQLYGALQQEYGGVGAGLAAAALLALPLMRKFTGLTMPDILSVALLFGAAMAFGNFVDRERKGDAALAGILGGLAILNSESGNAIWLIVALGLATARRLRVIRRPVFWGMGSLMLAASWLRGGAAMARHWNGGAALFYASQWGNTLGVAVGALMVTGMIVKLRRTGDHRGRWATAGGLLVGTPLWMALAPGELDARRLLPALPAALMFAVAGGDWLVRWNASRPDWGRMSAGRRGLVWTLLGALALLNAAGSWKREPCTGFAPLAQTLIEDSAPEDVTLVSSDPSGEERFIAELAMREQRPGHTVLCGTQFLANPGKKFVADEPSLPNDQAVFDFLTSGKVKYLALDDTIPDEERREHHYQIRRAIEDHLNRFWVIANCPMTRDGVTQPTPAKLYKIK